uniref:Uncharacterized protein n=1 Tax=Moniliophthora roreri TaxID=221103 RepID=A0A0W0FP12_MONRR
MFRTNQVQDNQQIQVHDKPNPEQIKFRTVNRALLSQLVGTLTI